MGNLNCYNTIYTVVKEKNEICLSAWVRNSWTFTPITSIAHNMGFKNAYRKLNANLQATRYHAEINNANFAKHRKNTSYHNLNCLN